MSYGLRSIAFVAELIHVPVKHDPRALQQLHGALFGEAACSYRDFRLVAGGAQLSNSVGGLPGTPVSSATLLADRIQIREEQTGASSEEFQARVQHVARLALSSLSVRAFLAQQYAVRSVVNVHTSNDTRHFLLRSVFGFDETLLSGFPAEPSLAGMRMTFPPGEPASAVFNVRVESFAQDNRSLFLENVGTFAQPIDNNTLPALGERFEATYDFLQEHLVDFVSQFDVGGTEG